MVKMERNSFIEKAVARHGNKYTYDRVPHSFGCMEKIQITCPVHGDFLQQATSHAVGGRGCGVCKAGGFNLNLEGSIYLLTDGIQLKIGITNSSAETRCNTINQLGKKNFKVLWSHTDIGKEIQHIEKLSLNEVRELYKNPVDKFNGYTECFITQDIEFILNIIKNNIQSV
jgi:hypothetical protein